MTEIVTTRAPRSKSTVRSFRLDEDVDRSLHEYALQEGISINSLVNKGLRRYVLWDTNASRFGGVTLAGASLTRIMNYLSDDEVREYARWVADNSVRDFVAFFFGEVTLHTLLKGLKLLADYGATSSTRNQRVVTSKLSSLNTGEGSNGQSIMENGLDWRSKNFLG